jgi:hypothetical protein
LRRASAVRWSTVSQPGSTCGRRRLSITSRWLLRVIFCGRLSSDTGARLLPNVSAPAVHELLDAVEAEVLSKNRGLSEYVPPRAPSPWLHADGEWWPLPSASS